MSNVHEQIEQLIKDNEVVLFMKGTRMFPQCGFSQRAVGLLKSCGAKFKDVNVLADPTIRQGIKEFSNWPTIPQCYIKGEFVGGSDILVEMYESGELQTTLGLEPEAEATEAPTVEITESAQAAFSAALKDVDDEVLRFDVSKGFDYDLYFGKKRDGDFAVQAGSLTIYVSKTSAARASGTRIDFVDGPDGQGFKIDNPNEPPKVNELGCEELAAKRKAGETIHVFDVRGDRERETASLAFASALDDAGLAKLAELPKDAMIVFHCHHGVRSRSAAEKFLAEGYSNLHNLKGGIDAWSLAVDPTVPRY